MLVYFTKFKFLLGDYKSVVQDIFSLLTKKKSQIILPCSLNDLALAENINYYKLVDLCVTDSMFLTWWFGYKYRPTKITRIYGPDLFVSMLEYLNEQKLQASFLIADQAVGKIFKQQIKSRYPQLNGQFYILGRSKIQEKEILKKIIDSKPRAIFIGVGSPKQIELASYLKDRISGLKIFCVGAAFDFFTGQKKQAPAWMRRNGLEWFFRLLTEPKRLWKRYLIVIPKYLFVIFFHKIFRKGRA